MSKLHTTCDMNDASQHTQATYPRARRPLAVRKSSLETGSGVAPDVEEIRGNDGVLFSRAGLVIACVCTLDCVALCSSCSLSCNVICGILHKKIAPSSPHDTIVF